MKLNRKWLLVLSMVLSFAMATTGTLAYLSDSETTTNTFTVGNVDIKLEEPSFDQNEDHVLMPGVEIAKDPQIENTGAMEAWVWMTVEMPTKLLEKLEIDWKTGAWTKSAGEPSSTNSENTIITLKRETKLPAGETTVPAFTKVVISPDVTDLSDLAALNGGELDIVVTAYGIQDAEFGNVDTAMRAFNGEKVNAKGDDHSKTYEVPENIQEVNNATELNDAVANGATTLYLKNGEYQWTGGNCKGKTLNLYGESKEGVVIYHSHEGESNTDYDFDGSTVNFYNLTISGEKNGASYPGWARMSATYNDCIIKQTHGLYAGTHTFNYCTLNVTGDQYNIWTWGAENATFNNCTFNSDGKALLLYGQANTKLTVTNCLFNDNGGLTDKKAAIEIGNDYGKSYELIVNNTKVNGYEINDKGIDTGTTLWGNKNSMGTDKLNVVVDGVDVY